MRNVIEVFSAGCPLCADAVANIQKLAGDKHEVRALDVRTDAGLARAKHVGAVRVPAVAVDGQLLPCCTIGEVQVDMVAARLT